MCVYALAAKGSVGITDSVITEMAEQPVYQGYIYQSYIYQSYIYRDYTYQD